VRSATHRSAGDYSADAKLERPSAAPAILGQHVHVSAAATTGAETALEKVVAAATPTEQAWSGFGDAVSTHGN
jgi:hypothetical protein